MKKDELTHYGILGMKWGIRRYQPYPKGEGHKGRYVGDKSKKKASSGIDDRLQKAVKDGSATITTDPKTGKRRVKFKNGEEWNMGPSSDFKKSKKQKTSPKIAKKDTSKSVKEYRKYEIDTVKKAGGLRKVEKAIASREGDSIVLYDRQGNKMKQIEISTAVSAAAWMRRDRDLGKKIFKSNVAPQIGALVVSEVMKRYS